ncbi:aldehyde dehydrogenase family protein [Streptomyces sp. CA-106110]|jgi:betaine-aldehyde dehydrogenase|uniref:aldehyde dehydrogenase family protein n=1 Tax=Streptomyces sp. CA-106110 TaxID=3240044 RepID=UPI003D8E2D26
MTTLWIAGRPVSGAGTSDLVINPATEETVASVGSASLEQVDGAVRAARDATDRWRRTPAAERADLLHGIANWLREHADKLAWQMSVEGGKPLVENTDEVGWAAACFDYYAELGRHERGRVLPPVEDRQLALVIKEPLGVVAAIVPWNYPLLLLAWKLAPALAAGNTVVAKPSPYTPLSTLMLAEAFTQLPPGVVNLIAGGAAVGEALVVHPGTDLVAFTGSTAAGLRIGELCARQVKRTHLELGGKDAFIVCEDADLSVAAAGAAWAAYLNAGQVCTSAERFYVADAVYDEFVDRMVAEAAAVRLGSPLAPGTDMGPVIAEVQRAAVERQLASARGAGARILVGGDHGGFDRGWYLSPSVVVDVTDDMPLMRDETFGPVAPIARVSSLDEAIARANALPYGLGANVYTNRADYAYRCLDELKAGTVWINDPLTDNDAGPFGGMKASGNSRELGPEGLESFRETKHVHWSISAERKPWWYPYQ